MSINIYEFDIGNSKKGPRFVTFYKQMSEKKNEMFKKKETQEDTQYKIAKKIDTKFKEIGIKHKLYNEKLKNNDVLTKSEEFKDQNFDFYKHKYKVYIQKGNPESYHLKGKKGSDQIESDEVKYGYMRDIFDIEIELPSRGTDTESYIYRWDVKDDKVFIFGDLHGSFHTFFRSMMRLHYCGIINENFEIKEKYRILFCGDIVDRGQYSLEILSFIFQLIKNNKDKVYMIRGNHETTKIYERKIFHNLKENLIDEFETKNLTEKQKTNVINFINNSPVAIILVCNGKKIWCCHGSIPYKLKNLVDINTLNKFIKNENNEENKIFKCKKKKLTTFIMWTDLYYESQTKFTERGIYDLQDIDYDTLKELFLLLGIDFMIRGHQDNDFNTTLYHGIEEHYYMIQKKKKNKYDYIDPKFGMPLLRFMMIDDTKKVSIVKTTLALTITTNMDVDRYLPRDSFIMVGPTNMNEDTLVVPENEGLKLKAVYNLKIPNREQKKGGGIIKFNNKRSKILKKYKNKKNNKKSKRIITKNIFNKKSKIKFSNRKINNRKIKTKKL